MAAPSKRTTPRRAKKKAKKPSGGSRRRKKAVRRARSVRGARWSWLRRVSLGALILVGAAVAFEAIRWPDVAALAEENPASTAFMDAAARRLSRAGLEPPRQRWVPSSQISANMQHAVVASEDINFFSHAGFDWGEIQVALDETFRQRKRLRGASTLTQQLAKNLWLSPSRNPTRKIREVLLTRQLERHLSKQRILEIYLNVAEFGDGIYGVESAARHYWGISAATLSTRQAAQLASSLPSPRRWHPGSSSKTYASRVRNLEARMAQSRWIRGQL